MPLAMSNVGEVRRVVRLNGDDAIITRLRDLGFNVGEEVEVVGETPSGMILSVKGVRFALNRGLANAISVA